MKTLKDERETVNILNRQRSVRIREDLKKAMVEAVEKVLDSEKFVHKAEVNIVLTGDRRIREMNRTYRGVDTPTDVLSFPMLEQENGGTTSPGDDGFFLEDGRVMLGDVVISAERALEQSKEYGHAFEREMVFLTVHGTLHLLGYDHIKEKDAKRMRTKEKEVLNSLGIKR